MNGYQQATQLHNLNKKSQAAVNAFYGGGSKWLWSTELCANQKARCAAILKTELGTIDSLVRILDIEYSILWVLLCGLSELGKIKITNNGGGFCAYRVLN